MRPHAFAWRSLTRQPARAVLGITGIAVVGALLFDMLLLSRGLVVSLEELLDATGFDVRATATESFPGTGPLIADAESTAGAIRALPEIDEVVGVRFGRAEVLEDDGEGAFAGFMGASGSARRVWTLLDGSGLDSRPETSPRGIVVNRNLAEQLDLRPGSRIRLRGACGEDQASVLPPFSFEVSGIAEFQFDTADRRFAVVGLDDFAAVCALNDAEDVEFFLIASSSGADTGTAVAAVQRALPGLYTFSNRQLVSRFESTDFSYFRQISFALATITLCFAFLLIATLLTVSVNQRLGEVATLRALGFPRRRVAADLLWESALLVGAGGSVALPLGGLLAAKLDSILRSIPGLPEKLHFFVFEPRAVWLYAALLVTTGLLAAIYPVYLAARLPIAATLRKEIIS